MEWKMKKSDFSERCKSIRVSLHWATSSMLRFICFISSAVAVSVASARPSGVIEGPLSFPSEDNPAMRVCAISLADPNLFRCVTSKFNQRRYVIKILRPGKYYVVAYPKPPASWGIEKPGAQAFTQAVVCGMRVACNDHSLVPVDVLDGRTVKGIDPADSGNAMKLESGFPPEPPGGSEKPRKAGDF
jgi:hypothetical protein